MKALSGPQRMSNGSVASQVSSIRIIAVCRLEAPRTDGPHRLATPPQRESQLGRSQCGWYDPCRQT